VCVRMCVVLCVYVCVCVCVVLGQVLQVLGRMCVMLQVLGLLQVLGQVLGLVLQVLGLGLGLGRGILRSSPTQLYFRQSRATPEPQNKYTYIKRYRNHPGGQNTLFTQDDIGKVRYVNHSHSG